VKIALICLNDPDDVHQWSGLNVHIAHALERAGATLHRIGPLASRWTPLMRLRQRWFDATGKVYHAVADPAALEAMGRYARARIPADADAVLAVTSLVAAAVGPLDIPFASWDDATYAGMLHYYPDFRRMPAVSRRQIATVGARAARAVSLAIYASEWAAASARDAYRLPAERVAVVPFGANLDALPSDADVERAIAQRPADVCRLLWVGVDWQRKGGPLTLAIAQALRDAGVRVELTIAGCDPGPVPEWAHVEGFISKREPGGEARLAALFARSHFFMMPSNAEAYGLVYAEAASFGVPSVAIRTGGVPTIIVDGETGLLEEPSTNANGYATRILPYLRDYMVYNRMSNAARRRAVQQLNWDVAGRRVTALLAELARPS
jgi:glycosyltransferase involved in cell wall biosynthesis